MYLAQGSQRSDAGEARTSGLSVSSQALYHWATALHKKSISRSYIIYYNIVKELSGSLAALGST